MAHMISPHLPLTVNTTLHHHHHHHHHHHSLYSLNNFLPSSSPITHTSIHSRPTTPFFFFNNPLISLTQNNTRTCRSRVSFLQLFQTKSEDLESLKQELLQIIAPLDRGADATPEQQDRVDQIARKLEAVNKIKEPLKSDLLNGKWELLYTTSQSILQTKRPKILRANGKIYQAINVDTLRAQNMETWPFFNQALKLNNYDDEPSVKSHGISISSNFTQIDGRALQAPRLKAGNGIGLFPHNGRWNFNNKATANLVPLNTKRVAVKFDAFKVFGLIPIKARGSGRGQLEITYLDEELRISRGNEGNLFILRMVDPSYRVPL